MSVKVPKNGLILVRYIKFWRIAVYYYRHFIIYFIAGVFDFNIKFINIVSNSNSINNLKNNKIMPIPDFGYSGGGNVTTPPATPPAEEQKTDLGSGKEVKLDANGNPIDDINSPSNPPAPGEDKKDDNKNNSTPANEFPHEYKAGTTLEVDGTTYTINETGDVVDSEGNVFKPAAEVSEWIKSFEVSEEDNDKEITVEKIAKSLDLEITDEEGKPITYENTPDGIKAFVEDAIETGRQEVAEATINSLYSQYPFVKPMIDYYIANGNSLEGYNQIPDRSNIQIDENNESQQESIIRTAWREDGRKGSVDSYIAYLKSQGTLAATAKEELEGLIAKDKAYAKQLEDDAKAEQQRLIEESTAYWNGVKQVIDSRKIAGYEIPETIIVERDGKKMSVTSNDFFNYLYRTDKDGLTGYARDVRSTKPEDALQDEILRAYLKFTGGTYADLVKMAINEEKVKNLKLQSRGRKPAGQMRITPPAAQTDNNNKESFGY